MNLKTEQLIEAKILAEKLWTNMEQSPEKVVDELFAELHEKGRVFIKREKFNLPAWKSIVIEIAAAVKEEIGDQIITMLLEPSRFDLLYSESMLRHGAEIKRKYAEKLQEEMRKAVADQELQYDVEKDIARTEAKLQERITAKLRLERLYLETFDKKDYKEASGYLKAIEMERSNGPATAKLESCYWRFTLGQCLKDMSMVKEEISNALMLKGEIEEEKLRYFLKSTLVNLLAETVGKGIRVIPTETGIVMALASDEGFSGYFEKQAWQFLRGVADEAASVLLTNPADDVITVTERVINEKRSDFLRVNPWIRDIR